jgi:hypothetical protein
MSELCGPCEWALKAVGRLRLKCDGTRAETSFRPSGTRTSSFKSAGGAGLGTSVQSTTCRRAVRTDTTGILSPPTICAFSVVVDTNSNDLVEITNKMQPCTIIYYSTVHWRLNMSRAAYRSSSGALTVFAASGLHMHVVTGRSQVSVLTTDDHHMCM